MINKIKYFKDKPVLADILDLLLLCIVTIIIGKIFTSYFMLPGHVPTSSMEGTISAGDRMLTNRTSYWKSSPQRGDIVVFYYPDAKMQSPPEEVHYVKRIIGLPGETVTIQDGAVYINGVKLDEPYIHMSTKVGESYVVPEGHYFMLGDNRNNSADSRAWEHKFVPEADILGKVFFKYSLLIDNIHARAVYSYNDYNI